MKITRGKINSAQKVVVYGPEGIGKSTFAAQFPDPLFIDTEGSTKHMDVARLPVPKTWEELQSEIKYIIENSDCCKTLVIDTIDWAEQLCIESICKTHEKNGIEDFGYGNGYVYTKEEFGRLLKTLEDVIDKGINVVLTAHSQIRKFEQPDELGAYDRYELKLGKKTFSQTSPLVKEWADMLLFANYKTLSVAVDDKGKKHKAQGGKRVMYTSHHPCWDAKNRHNLDEELVFDFKSIAHLFSNKEQLDLPDTQEVETERIKQELDNLVDEEPVNDEKPNKKQGRKKYIDTTGLPDELSELMTKNEVSKREIQEVVSDKGYYPEDTPVENYDPQFITDCLIGAWDQVFEIIKQNKKLPWEQ